MFISVKLNCIKFLSGTYLRGYEYDQPTICTIEKLFMFASDKCLLVNTNTERGKKKKMTCVREWEGTREKEWMEMK